MALRADRALSGPSPPHRPVDGLIGGSRRSAPRDSRRAGVSCTTLWDVAGPPARTCTRVIIPAARQLTCPVPGPRPAPCRLTQHTPAVSPYDQQVVNAHTTISTWQQSWDGDRLGDRQQVIDILGQAAVTDPTLLECGLPLQ